MTIRPWLRIGRRTAGVLALAIASWSCAISAGAQQTQVQRGEYLARAGDCISCHTAKGGEPYAGGLRLDSPFGYMLSPNITPDPETDIGRWSSADFQRRCTMA
jgi:mono/diheme cytochrome c family protein